MLSTTGSTGNGTEISFPNMSQDKSSVMCHSLSWDSYPLQNVSNRVPSVTFSEIERFLQNDASSMDLSSRDLQQFVPVRKPELSNTPSEKSLNRFLIDRSDLMSVDSLLKALPDLGLFPTSTQVELIKNSIQVGEENVTRFGGFVDCIKTVFDSRPKEKYGTSEDILKAPTRQEIQNCLNCATANQDVEKLTVVVQHLENRLNRAEQACSTTEQKLLCSKKELQEQIACSKKLADNLDVEVQSKTMALHQAKVFEQRLNAAESKLKSAMTALDIAQEYNDDATSNNYVDVQCETSDSKLIVEPCLKDPIFKVLQFLESLRGTLKQLIKEPTQASNIKIGRSFSLYRNATVTSAGQSAVPRGAVLRAASLCTSVRPHNPGSNGSVQNGRGLGSDSGSVNLQSSLASLLQQSDEITLLVKEALNGEYNASFFGETVDCGTIKKRPTKKPLQNLPSSTVVTVMSSV